MTDAPPFGVPLPESVVSAPEDAGPDHTHAYDGEYSYVDWVEVEMNEDMCALCSEILAELRERPPQEQVEGVEELHLLKQAAEDGAGVVELAEIMADFDVVADPSMM